MFLLGLLKSTALYAAALALLVALTGGGDFTAAVVLLILYVILFALSRLVFRLRYGKVSRSARADTLVIVGYDIQRPFRGLMAFSGAARVIDGSKGRRAFSWATVWLHFVWSLALLATVGVTVYFALR